MLMQAEQGEAGWLNFRGVYAFRFNAENLIKPYGNSRDWPTFEGASVSATQQAALTQNTLATLASELLRTAVLAAPLQVSSRSPADICLTLVYC